MRLEKVRIYISERLYIDVVKSDIVTYLECGNFLPDDTTFVYPVSIQYFSHFTYCFVCSMHHKKNML